MLQAQLSQGFGILVLQGLQQGFLHISQVAGNFQGLCHNDLETVMWQCGASISEDVTDGKPCGPSLHKHSWVNRRSKQGKRSLDAFDVQTVSNLVESIGNGIPERHQVLVARNIEVECLLRNVCNQGCSIRILILVSVPVANTPNQHGIFVFKERVCPIKIPVFSSVINQIICSFDFTYQRIWGFRTLRTKNIRRHNVELYGEIHGFCSILREEFVATGNERVQVFHDYEFLVSHQALFCNQVRFEGVELPLFNQTQQVFFLLRIIGFF